MYVTFYLFVSIPLFSFLCALGTRSISANSYPIYTQLCRRRRTNTDARNKAPGRTSSNGNVGRSRTTQHGTSTASSRSAPSGGSSFSYLARSPRSSLRCQSSCSRLPSRRAGCNRPCDTSSCTPSRCWRAAARSGFPRDLSCCRASCHLAYILGLMRSVPVHVILPHALPCHNAFYSHMPSSAPYAYLFLLSYFMFLYTLPFFRRLRLVRIKRTHTFMPPKASDIIVHRC